MAKLISLLLLGLCGWSAAQEGAQTTYITVIAANPACGGAPATSFPTSLASLVSISSSTPSTSSTLSQDLSTSTADSTTVLPANTPSAVTVASDGSGQYTNINSAIAFAQANAVPTVTVKAGTYTETISIVATATVTIVGETATTGNSYSDNLVTITNGGGTAAPVTFGTSTSKGVTWKNLNFVNSNAASAAGIIFLRGSRNAFYSCQFTAASQVGFTGSQAAGLISDSYIEAADKNFYSFGSLYVYKSTITATNNNALLVYNKGALDTTGKQYNSTIVFDTCQVIQKPGKTNTNVYLAAANDAGSVVVYRDTSIASNVAGTGVYVDAKTQDARNTYIESGTTGAGSYSNKVAARSAYVSFVTDVAALASYDISVFFSRVFPTVAVTNVDWIDASVLALIKRSSSASASTSASTSSSSTSSSSSSLSSASTSSQDSSTSSASSVASTSSASTSESSTASTASTDSSSTSDSSIASSSTASSSTASSSTASSSTASSTAASSTVVDSSTSAVATTSDAASTTDASTSSAAAATTSSSPACLPSGIPSTAFIVGAAGSSCATHNSIAAAIAALPADTTTQYIYILAGTYNEKASLVRTGSTILRGETDNALSSSSNKVTIQNASAVLSSAGGSAGTATFSANKYEAKLVSFYNINFENSYPAQTNYIALAAYSKGTKVAFYSCNVKSSQGSLYLDYGNVFFSGGRIEGTTDFVWGIGAGYFYNSVIVSTDTAVGTTIAAQRYQNAYGGSQLVFDGCAVVASSRTVPQQSVYLGRDYSTNATVAFLNSYLDGHINTAGWKIGSAATFIGTFAEANNTGPGASTTGRPSTVKIISDTSAYTVKKVLADDTWLDSAAIAPQLAWPDSVYAVVSTSTSAAATTTSATQTDSTIATTTTSSTSNTFTVAPLPATGEFGSISSAVAALPADGKEYTIFIKAGTYEEQVSITRRGKVTLRGETTFKNDFTKNSVLVNFSRGVSTSLGRNEETPVMNWKNTAGDGLALYNINFTNTYPQQSSTAALAGDFFGTNMAAYGCAFDGFQDTLLVNQGVQVFSNSYIEGSVDFIWGYSKAYFHQCYVASNTPRTYITAQNRPSASWAGGFVFDKSVITYTSSFGSDFGNTFLGRPWSQYAITVYLNSFLDKHISPAGWSVWQSSNPQTANVLFGEYNNVGPGNWSDSRASFATKLTEAQAAQYSFENFIGGSWIDTEAFGYTPSYSLTGPDASSEPTVPTTPVVLTHPSSGTVPPAGAVLVAADGSISGAFTSLTAALASLPSDSTSQIIFIYPGTYNEQVPSINRPGPVMIIGYTADEPGKGYKNNQVTITQSRGLSVSPAPVGHSNAETATIATASSKISWYNVNLVNSDNLDGAIPSYVTLAASVYGDKIGFYGCSFVGWQDTLLTGATAGMQYYESCYIDGAIDFIWGYSKAYFKGCTIAAKRAKSAITAHSRSSLTATGGYIFDQCLFTEAPTATVDLKGLVYLGRPYSKYALVVIKNSHLTDVIQPAGWKIWSTTDPRTDFITFAEYNNIGPGSWENNVAARQAFQNCTLLTSDEYPLSKVMSSTDWIDLTYWDKIQTPEPAVVPVVPTTPTVYDGTKPPAGALVVSKTPIEGQATYDTIQAALNALPASNKIVGTVFIYPGTYNEQLILAKAGTTILLGYSSASGDCSQNQVTINFNKGIDTQADASNSDSATVYATGNYLQAVNINFANTFGTATNFASLGFGVKSSKYASLYGCQVYGNQDSLLINGFFFASNSYIEGNIDMIWGSGAGYFLNSTIAPNRDGIALTANKRATNTTAAGFVFDQCTITPAKSAKYSSISLGRPWNLYARVAYVDSYLDSSVKAAGWDQWTKSDPRTAEVVFGEFANDGPGSGLSSRASFATKLTAETAAQFELANFFAATSWINMTLVSAVPFKAGAVVLPAATSTTAVATSTSSMTSSSVPPTTTTVFTTRVSTLKETLITSVQGLDVIVTQKSTLTINAATTITPPAETRTSVITSTTVQVATVQEPDTTVTQKTTTTVQVGTTITPAPVVTTSTSVATSTRTEVVTQQAQTRTITSTTITTRWATSTPKIATTTQVIRTTLLSTKTTTPKPVTVRKTDTQTIGDGTATTITAKALTTTATVFVTTTRAVKKTTTIKCISTNGPTKRSLEEVDISDIGLAAAYLEARAVGDKTVTVTVISTFSTFVKTSTVTIPGSTSTSELLTTKTEGKPVTLKPSTVVETTFSVQTRPSTTTLAGKTSTTVATAVVSAGKTTTLKPATQSVIVQSTTTVVVKSTTKLATSTQNVVETQTRVSTSVLPQQTNTVTRLESSAKTVTVVLPVTTATILTTVRSTVKPSATVTNRSTVTKTKTSEINKTTTTWVTKTSKGAKTCTAA
ncbi:pectin lyase fold/virulence factor [Plectosphaerella plurivora]|uniref:pectinesterase n=1 Tax=Plectosphaerella plurivora TaxID=936078 RepID=A0A9P9ABD6_9PEZI|nr:pectin lyase fold/virulence factor [Plectosphaerella plurivora]